MASAPGGSQRSGPPRKTKIVATIGPASRAESVLQGLLRAGMNVARIYFSHETHEQAAEVVARLRRLAAEERCVVALLADLQGPRLRIGPVAGGQAPVDPGSRIVMTTQRVPGDAREVTVEYADLPRAVTVGDQVVIDDGRIQLQVESLTATDVVCRAIVGGLL